ncbi:kinase-like domain-containing protein, partial [Hyaloscypha finlandica]
GQGDVYEAVDINTGEHYACKVVAFKGPIPQWNIKKESEFKRRIRDEVEIVEKASHDHIVPYVHHQGWETERPTENFMPVYEGNLQALLERVRLQGEEAVRATADRMLCQILDVLDHFHARGIIHRDIKPENILFQDDDFFLTDFGIAKPIDTAKTMAGTEWYMAPELWLNGA